MRIVIEPNRWEIGRGYRKNRLAGESELDCPGALVQLVVMEPGANVPDHVHHTSTEFYYVTGGQCRLVLNQVEHLLATGDMFLIRPGDVHRLHNDREQPFTLLVMKTNATLRDTLWGDTGQSSLDLPSEDSSRG